MDTKRKIDTRKRQGVGIPRSRFADLVHYVCARCGESPEKLGATKLNKALWYIDTIAYCKLGRSVSGETMYVKQKFGPVPRHILSTLQMLEATGDIAIADVDYFGHKQRHFVALRPPNLKAFSAEERALIDEIVRVICDEHTAASISELSHDVIWDAAELGEDIPVYAVLAAERDDITRQDKVWANRMIGAIVKKGKDAKRGRTVRAANAH